MEVNRATGASALNWTTAIDLEEGSTFVKDDVVVRVGTSTLLIAFTASRLLVSGTATIDVLGFVRGTVGIAYESDLVDADVDGNGTRDLAGASLGLLHVTVNDLFLGDPGGIGFTATGGSIAVATLAPAVSDGRSWLALKGSLASAQLVGLDGVTLALSNVVVEINRGTGADALNWLTAIDRSENTNAADFDAETVAVQAASGPPVQLTATSDLLTVGGIAIFNLFGFVSGGAALELRKRRVDLNLDSDVDPELDDAQLTTFALSILPGQGVTVGVDGIGLTAAGGSFAIAIIAPALPAAGQPADTRRWTSIRGTLTDARLTGGPAGITASASVFTFDVNRAAGARAATLGSATATPTPATPLNWAQALRFADTGAYAQPLTVFEASGDGVPTITFDHTTELLKAAGTISVGVDEFVNVSGSFALERGADRPIVRVGETTPTQVSVLAIGISDAAVFAGIGAGTAGALGVQLADVDVAIAIMKQTGAAPTRSFLALKGSGRATLVGVDGITLTGTLGIEVNTGTDTALPAGTVAPAADLSKLPGGGLTVVTGPGTPAPTITLGFASRLVRVTGTATIAVDGFAYLSGAFAITKSDAPIAVKTADPDGTAGPKTAIAGKVTALTIGASDVKAFFGIGGPYWDTDADGDVDDADAAGRQGATGLALSDVTVAVALFKPADGTFAGAKSFTALKATGDVALVGIDDITLSIDDATIEVNRGPPVVPNRTTLPALDLTTVAGGAFVVPTGPSSSVALNYTGERFLLAGTARLTIADFVQVSGSVAVSRGETRTINGVLHSVLTIGATGVNVFAGTGAGTADAVGVQLTGVEVAMAIVKPTTLGATRSYHQLRVTATSVALVGVPDVTLSSGAISVEVNGSNDRAVNPAVLDLSGAKALTVRTGPDETDTAVLDLAGSLLRVSVADATLGIAGVEVTGDLVFERSVRANGTRVVKVAITDLRLSLGGAIDIGPASAFLVMTPAGTAGKITTQVTLGTVGGNFYFNGTLALEINTGALPVNEEFSVGAGLPRERLVLPGGPFVRLSGTAITLNVLGTTMTGNFVFESVERAGQRIIRIAATNVGLTTGPTGFTLVGGEGAFVLYPNGAGIAGRLGGTLTGPAVPGGGNGLTAILQVNTTAGPKSETIPLAGGSVGFTNIAPGFSFALRNVEITVLDLFTLTGDFVAETLDSGLPTERLRYAATNVRIFLGEGPFLLPSGAENPAAVGVLLRDATVGVVKYTGGTTATTDDRWAVSATGVAELRGLPGVTVTGTMRLRLNETGRAVNETITIPGIGDIPSLPVLVQFDSPATVEVFEATGLTIDAAGIFVVSGNMRFSRGPAGRLEVDATSVSITIKIPLGNGTLQEAIRVSGAARFAFGGATGLQLQSLRVTSFAIAGFTIPNPIPAPASSLRAPEADLVGGARITRDDLLRGYLDVRFRDINLVGLNVGSITDETAEFVLSGAAAANILINGRGVQLDPNDPTLFRYAISARDASLPLVADDLTDAYDTIRAEFLPGTFTDVRNATNGADVETFFAPAVRPSTPIPTALLVSPFAGATIGAAALAQRPWLDVTFLPGVAGAITGVGVEDLTIGGINAARVQVVSVEALPGNTFRFHLARKTGVAATEPLFLGGPVSITISNAWGVAGQTVNPAPTYASFTVDPTLVDAAATTAPTTIGPLTLTGLTVGLVGTTFKGGNLDLTIGIGATSAALAFGGGSVSTRMTGVLGTFDVRVDLLRAASAIGNPSQLLSAFSVSGKWGFKADTLEIAVAGLLTVSATKIAVGYDPGHDRATLGAQKLVTVESAAIAFPTFNVTGVIAPITVDGVIVPGLTVWEDGFRLGRAELQYRPGRNGAPAKISIGSILEFDDLRIGVTDFTYRTGGAAPFSGTVYFASGGVAFLPGRTISGRIIDRLGVGGMETAADTEAVRVSVTFTDGEVDGFRFAADTLEISFGSYLKVTAVDFVLDTGAGDSEELVSFTEVGATVTAGPLSITGKARNFAFLGDGSFDAKPGFGVFLSTQGVDGSTFKWPSFLPIQIDAIGVEWRNIETNPADMVITLSVSVTGISGLGPVQVSGSVQGLKIDIGLLAQGKFPIIDVAAIAVSVSGPLFGGEISGTLLGGLLKLDSTGRSSIRPTRRRRSPTASSTSACAAGSPWPASAASRSCSGSPSSARCRSSSRPTSRSCSSRSPA